MARKTKTKPKPEQKEQICVRMDKSLFDLIIDDSEDGGRTPPAQVRQILRVHYAARLKKKTKKRRR